MVIWKQFLHYFDESTIVSNWKDFWNIYIWPENVASKFVARRCHKKFLTNLCPLWAMNMRQGTPSRSISTRSSKFSFRNRIQYFPTNKHSLQSAISPLKIPVNCVIIRGKFQIVITRELNLPLLTQVPLGAKNYATISIMWQWIFESPVVSRLKMAYILVQNPVSKRLWLYSCFHLFTQRVRLRISLM